jgi:enterochelin esterase-like enzyme
MQKLSIVLLACALISLACSPSTPIAQIRRGDRTHSTIPATAPADVVYGNETIWVNNPPTGFLPAGMTHHTYFSQSMQHDVGYCIYLPPAYQKHPARRFPVIYDLHGINRNELHGMLAAQVLQEGIEAGKWPDIIMVFPNGGSHSFYQDHPEEKSADGKIEPKVLAETTIIRELIPHIDQTYRTIGSREGRCIEGFSMGGLGAMYFALKYPDMFCSLFSQAGTAHKAPFASDAFGLLQRNLERIKGKLRIQIFCGTQDQGHLPSLREFHQALIDDGVDHTYLEIEGLGHDLPGMIQRYRAIWFDYHVESLRQSGGIDHGN